MSVELAPGERRLWEGRPYAGFLFGLSDLFPVAVGVVWLAMVVAISVTSYTGHAGSANSSVYVMLPFFILVGVYVTFGRIFPDILTRRRTTYTLTSERAIIEGGLLTIVTKSVNLASTSEITYTERGSGRATIEFGSSGSFGLPRGWPGARRYMAPAFEAIEDGRRVYELALKAQRDLRQRS
jgi:hypothetical protein